MIKKHGAEFTVQSPKLHAKVLKTIKKKFGGRSSLTHPTIKAKTKRKMMENHGVTNPSQSPKLIAEKEARFYKKHGVKNPMQVPEYHRRQQKSGFTLDSDGLRGYERNAYGIIRKKTSFKKADITFPLDKKIPTFSFPFEGKIKTYTPDFYIKKLNLIIEVKSGHYYSHELFFKRNKAKQKACLKQGYDFVYMILNKEGEIINEQYNLPYPSFLKK